MTPWLLLVSLGGAPTFPTLQAGRWQLHRVLPDPEKKGATKTIDVTRCEDPNQTLQRQRAMLEKIGCRFGDTRRQGDTFTTVAQCTIGGVTSRHTNVTVLTKDGFEATIDTETTVDGHTTKERETLVGKRLGDCR